MLTLFNDLRYALRQLRKTPGMAAACDPDSGFRDRREHGDLYGDRKCSAAAVALCAFRSAGLHRFRGR